ncbi:glycosyltransferase family 87 protein [Myxacorys almedinensis]|uniref:DUF2029 domain-containing protein n=1 Tax=Myxacorys almedinensis A TaxID=2690445 RepID=A0A8J7Z556_9CYAN|nr:glycosyltransferase family 87 protein [Myxacorys almedinensis]NDJ15705.1 DUF2029 domain-containing protein [Myxacorys almedinensis A]
MSSPLPTPHAQRPTPPLRRFLGEYFIYLLPSALIVYLVLESYQIDFRPYYLAGKSILYGLDPYLNHVHQYPEFYTPVNAETSPGSGFIYPPFAALLFAPLALLPYVTAKTIYSVITLVVLWLLLFELVKHSKFAIQGESLLFVMASFPVIASFERGQIDIFVCYITTLGFLIHRRSGQRLIPAFLLALSFCIKLFPGIALIYFLIKREYKLVAYAFGFISAFFLAPLAYFNGSVYGHYVQRILPKVFGALTSPTPISTHGQGTVNRVVLSVENRGLRVTHDFVNGYMNPFLRHSPVASMMVGAIAVALLLYYLRRASLEHQFFSIVNSIHLFNPQTWIMGLVWYIPLFVYLFGKANPLGKFILVLPLFVPPFTNSNGMLAYAITLAFAIPHSRARLLQRLEAIH